MKAILILALLSTVSFAQTTVIGGKIVSPAWYPYVPKIKQLNSSYPFTCSASLVGPRVALFAAHCFYKDSSGKGLLLFGEKWLPLKVILSPLWETKFHDLAVGILERPITLWAYSSVDTPASVVGEELTVMGYGCDEEGALPDGQLRKGQFQMQGYFQYNSLIMMASGESSTCSGDSGGPTFRRGSRLQVGVTSGGAQSVSYLTRLDTEESVEFLRAVTRDYGVLICGINADCL